MTEKQLTQLVGKNISRLRRKENLTSEQLAYQNDFSKGYLSDIENGKKLPSLRLLLKLSKVLNCEMGEFF